MKYPHLKQQQLFYSNPDTMWWRSTFAESGSWISGAEQEPPWFAEATYEVEPAPDPVYYQRHMEVPAPESVAPHYGVTYRVPQAWGVEIRKWNDSQLDKQYLRDGLIHLSYEDAEARRKAWLLLDEV